MLTTCKKKTSNSIVIDFFFRNFVHIFASPDKEVKIPVFSFSENTILTKKKII